MAFQLNFKGISRGFSRLLHGRLNVVSLVFQETFFKALSCCMALIAATRAASVGASAKGHFLLEIAQSDIYHGSIMWSAS